MGRDLAHVDERALERRAARRRDRRPRRRRCRRAALGARRGARSRLGHGGAHRRRGDRARGRAHDPGSHPRARRRPVRRSASGCRRRHGDRRPRPARGRRLRDQPHRPRRAAPGHARRRRDADRPHRRLVRGECLPGEDQPAPAGLRHRGTVVGGSRRRRGVAVPRRRLRDGGPAQLDRRLVQDLQPTALTALSVPARRGGGRLAGRHRLGHLGPRGIRRPRRRRRNAGRSGHDAAPGRVGVDGTGSGSAAAGDPVGRDARRAGPRLADVAGGARSCGGVGPAARRAVHPLGCRPPAHRARRGRARRPRPRPRDGVLAHRRGPPGLRHDGDRARLGRAA